MVNVNCISNGSLVLTLINKVLNESYEETPDVYFALLYADGNPIIVLYDATKDAIQVMDITTFESMFSALRSKDTGGYVIKNVKADVLSKYIIAANRLRKLIMKAICDKSA